jgi:hypothetical protein
MQDQHENDDKGVEFRQFPCITTTAPVAVMKSPPSYQLMCLIHGSLTQINSRLEFTSKARWDSDTTI